MRLSLRNGFLLALTSEYLDPAVRISVAMKQAMAVGNVGFRNDTAIERLMLGLMTSNPDVSGVELGRSDGSFVYVRRNGDGYQTKTITKTGGRRVVLVDRSAGFEETKSTEDRNVALSDLLRRADLEMLAAKPNRRPHEVVAHGQA
jgi:hypothetical protein